MPQERSRSRLSSDGNSLKTSPGRRVPGGVEPGPPGDDRPPVRRLPQHAVNGRDPAPLVERQLEEPPVPIRLAQQLVRLGWRRQEGLARVRLQALREGDEEDDGRQGGTQRARTPPEPKLERQRGGDHRGPPRRQEEALHLPHLPQGRQHRRERAEEPLEERLPVVEADRAAEGQEDEDEGGERGRARREAEAGLDRRGLRPRARRTHQVRASPTGRPPAANRAPALAPVRADRVTAPASPASKRASRRPLARCTGGEGAASGGGFRARTASVSASAARPHTRRTNPVPG